MAKKTFVVTRAAIAKGKRYGIDYEILNTRTGETERNRHGFGLDEIEDPILREAVAKILCKNLNKFLIEVPAEAAAEKPAAIAATDPEQPATVREALALVLSLKTTSERDNSNDTYRSQLGIFMQWAEKRSYADIPVRDFSRRHALAYFDWLRTQKTRRNTPLQGRTLNNYRKYMLIVWNVLVKREIVDKNPFSVIETAKKNARSIRAFTDEERRVVAAEIQKTDYWLFRALLLQFYCYLRPVEITRLRFRAFDFQKGTIKVESHEAKTWKTRYCTIPASVMHYFTDGRFDRYPANYYVLGLVGSGGREAYDVQPSYKPIGDDRMYKRHKKVLERLKAAGKLRDITGLAWYSWKYTGISKHARATSPMATKDQAGHTDFKITMGYYEPEPVIEEYRKLADDLLA